MKRNVICPTICVLIHTILYTFIQTRSQQAFSADDGLDILMPYISHHGPKHRTNREIRECQHIVYGNRTHSKKKVHQSKHILFPIVETKRLALSIGQYYFNQKSVLLHFTIVNNPRQSLSVLEPLEEKGCVSEHPLKATVEASALRKNCLFAANAGFFNTTSGSCLGNIISDGQLVQDSEGIQNAHFGITKDGYIYTGYLSEIDVIAEDFLQLVGGVIWLVREGKSYVAESMKMECSDTEETGSIDRFVNVISARTAVGHNAEGKVILVQVEGETDKRGVNLFELADILIDLGAVNAINMDGGGSTTAVINQTLVNYPSDKCADEKFRCARNASTIFCVHEPFCDPADCSGHGRCVLGRCECDTYWSGKSCNTLKCPNECSGHGQCSQGGCLCNEGYFGRSCKHECLQGYYGKNCSQICLCNNGAICNSKDGTCDCPEGYAGKYCQFSCAYGFYGKHCKNICKCDTECGCHPINGSCKTTENEDFIQAGSCLASKMISEKHLVKDQSDMIRMCLSNVIVLATIAASSVCLNAVLIYLLCKQRWSSKQKNKFLYEKSNPRKKSILQNNNLVESSDHCSSSESVDEETSFIKPVKSPDR